MCALVICRQHPLKCISRSVVLSTLLSNLILDLFLLLYFNSLEVESGALNLFGFYLVKLISRKNHFQKLFNIQPCSQPWIDMVVDTLFEYSLLVNLLLIGTCVGCTRWILMPWLIVYSINIVLLGVVAIYLFINPVPMFQYTREHAHYELMRLFGLVPIGAMVFLGKEK